MAYMGAWPHGVRIDLESDDYIDYIDYRPCALVLRGQRGPAPWCCAASAALRPGAAPWQSRGRGWQGRAVRATATERQRTIFLRLIFIFMV